MFNRWVGNVMTVKIKYSTIKEKNKVKRTFGAWILLVFFFILIFNLFSYFFFQLPVPILKTQKNILLILPQILVAILISVFFISGVKKINDFPISRRGILILYICWLIPSIIFPLFLLIGTIPLSAALFKTCILLFIASLVILVPYVFIFIHSDINGVLALWYIISAQSYIYYFNKVAQRKVMRTNKNITSMTKLIIDSIRENDYPTFFMGIERVESLGKIILETKKISIEHMNKLFKHIIKNHRFMVAESIKQGLEDFTKDISSKISNLIKYYMEARNEIAKKIDYPIAIIEIRKVGLMCIESNMQTVSSEIIENLGQLAESPLNERLEQPPDIEALRSLQKIGIECADRKMETLCIDCLLRTQSIADFAKKRIIEIEVEIKKAEAEDMESKKIGEEIAGLENEKAGMEKVYRSALKSHWIISAYLFENVPGSRKYLEDLREEMKENFGKDYDNAYNQVIDEMKLTYFGGEKILNNLTGFTDFDY
jgi:hypothetical protein